MSKGLRVGMGIAVAAGLALSGCAAPRERISSTLQQYGLDARRANCAASYLEGHLSYGQLHDLARAARAYTVEDPDPSRLTFGDLLRVSRQVRDPRIAIEVGGAALACGVVGDLVLPRF